MIDDIKRKDTQVLHKLSIITVNLNNKGGLKRTIDSVVSQTCRYFEWIVIDGGSSDGSKEFIEENAEYISYWVSEPDTGIYNAMNKGIRASHGEYLLFLNSGDYLYDAEVLQRVIPMLQGKDFYVGYELIGDTVVKNDISTLAKIFYIITTSSLPHQSTFINRCVFSKYGFYREDLKTCSDWYMFYKAIIMGNATVERLHFIIAIFNTNGISQTESALSERKQLFLEIPNIDHAIKFYYQNCDIVHALKESRFVFFMFRVYYFFYRITKTSRCKSSCQKYR